LLQLCVGYHPINDRLEAKGIEAVATGDANVVDDIFL